MGNPDRKDGDLVSSYGRGERVGERVRIIFGGLVKRRQKK